MSYLIAFDKNFAKKDCGEFLADVGLGLLRLGFGKVVKVTTESNKVVVSKQKFSTLTRICAIALFILVLPVAALLTAFGCIGAVSSRSYAQKIGFYAANMNVSAQPQPLKEDAHGSNSIEDKNLSNSIGDTNVISSMEDTNVSNSSEETEVKVSTVQPKVATMCERLEQPNYYSCFEDMHTELKYKSDIAYRSKCPIDSPKNKVQMARLFDNDPDICFVNETVNVQDHAALINILSSAFSQRKKIAVLTFGDHRHAECAAFDAQGNFIILAGWVGIHTVSNIHGLSHTLNAAAIKDDQGKVITFSGHYIDTGLQQGGHHCTRIAEIYKFQIAKDRDLQAYQKVNAAFYDKNLHSFEDIDKISACRELKTLPKSNSLYDWESTQFAFFLSWIYRTYGIKQNNWKDIPIHNIAKSLSWVHYLNVPITQYFLFPTDAGIPQQELISHFRVKEGEEHVKRFVKDDTTLEGLRSDECLVLDKTGNHFFISKSKIEPDAEFKAAYL